MGRSEQAVERSRRLETVLRAQAQRVAATLVEAEPLDATPILRPDETLRCEEYITLVDEFHHVVLPELADDGLVQVDRQADEVQRGERFDAVVSRPSFGAVDERR